MISRETSVGLAASCSEMAKENVLKDLQSWKLQS